MLLVGVLIPDVGAFLLLFVPEQDIVPEDVIRLIMLVGALIVPGGHRGAHDDALAPATVRPADRRERRSAGIR